LRAGFRPSLDGQSPALGRGTAVVEIAVPARRPGAGGPVLDIAALLYHGDRALIAPRSCEEAPHHQRA
jgi:hypothetical protein